MKQTVQTIVRAVLSVVVAWLLWGVILNGAAYMADVFGRESAVGNAFGGITFWLGHFGFGVLFFVLLSAVLFILSGLIRKRGKGVRGDA